MWAEFPEKEILDRVEDNKKEIKEIDIECKCIASSRKILKDFDIEGKEILPLVIYSTVQPLSLPKLRELYKVPSNVMVVTLSELKELLSRNTNPLQVAFQRKE